RNLTHALDLAHFRNHLRRRGAVDRNERNRRSAFFVPPEREGRDVDAGVAEKARETADEAWLVLVGDIDHRRGELRVDLNALDRENPRFAVMKDGPADG